MSDRSLESFEVEVLSRLARIEEKMDGSIARLEDIEHDLYGNGRPGLLAEHIQLRTEVAERTNPKKVAGIASALTSVITILGALLAREAGV